MSAVRSRRGLVLLACPALLAIAAGVGLAFRAPEVGPTISGSIVAAQLFLSRGDSQRAEEELRRDPGIRAKFMLAGLLADRGEWLEAKALLIDTSSHPEYRDRSLRLLASGSMKHRDWESARASLTELLKATPKDPAFLKALAIPLRESGDSMGALHNARQAFDATPADADLAALMSELAEDPSASYMKRSKPDVPHPLRFGRRTR